VLLELIMFVVIGPSGCVSRRQGGPERKSFGERKVPLGFGVR